VAQVRVHAFPLCPVIDDAAGDATTPGPRGGTDRHLDVVHAGVSYGLSGALFSIEVAQLDPLRRGRWTLTSRTPPPFSTVATRCR
jgi:hypothetical protein